MTESLRSPSPLYSLELSSIETDAERLGRVKRALREADQHCALAVTGSFAGDVSDVRAHAELIALLLDASLPIFALPSGPIGLRGLALLLTADQIVLGENAAIAGLWREAPGIATILHDRFGSLTTRALLFGTAADPLAALIERGLAVRSADPSADVQAMSENLAGGLGRRLKRALRASAELPLEEALTFDFWFARNQQASAG